MKLRDLVLGAGASDLRSVVVHVPEWDREVEGVKHEFKAEVRELSLLGRTQWREKGFVEEPDPALPKKTRYVPKQGPEWLIHLLVACTFEPGTNERVFTIDDAAELLEKNDAAVNRLIGAALDLNFKEEEGSLPTENFTPETPRSSSPADSPERPAEIP